MKERLTREENTIGRFTNWVDKKIRKEGQSNENDE